jgi:hypothetical protein
MDAFRAHLREGGQIRIHDIDGYLMVVTPDQWTGEFRLPEWEPIVQGATYELEFADGRRATILISAVSPDNMQRNVIEFKGIGRLA